MKKSIVTFTLCLAFAGALARGEVVLDEIKTNLDEAQKKVETARKQIAELEANDLTLKKNIQELNSALNKKLDEQKDVTDTYNDYQQKLGSTANAKKEFEKSLEKDRRELALVEKDLEQVERKLESLKAARKALKESIDISEDNLSKMSDRSGSWQKNLDHITKERDALQKDVDDLEAKKEAQEKSRLENQQALNKWKKSLATQELTYQKLDSKYRQAVKEAEKKAKRN